MGFTLLGFCIGITWQYGQSANLIKKTPERGLKTVTQGFYGGVPVHEVHTMRQWEDGSYEIVYKDGTSETGCAPRGLCND